MTIRRFSTMQLGDALRMIEGAGIVIVAGARREPAFGLAEPRIEKEPRIRDWEQRERPKHRKRSRRI